MSESHPEDLAALLRQAGLCFISTVMPDGSRRVAVADPNNPSRYYSVRGEVLSVTSEGAAEHIEQLAQRYLGTPYPWYGGRDQTRVILTIEAHKIHSMG
jgi:hypothetical protein